MARNQEIEEFNRGLRKNNTIDDEEAAYVAVKDSEDGEILELPCNPDRTLSLATLSHSFPGATGLKFKNPKTGASRAVMLDPQGQNFLCPAGGWEDKTFTAIFPPRVSTSEPPSAGGSSYVGKVEAKRRKVNHSESDSEDDILPRNDRQKAATVSKRERLSKPTDLLILGLPPSIEDDTVRNYLETFGPVKLLNIKRNSDGQGKGFGFCIFVNVEDQEKVLYQSHTIGGRLCEIKLPDRPYTGDTGGSASSQVARKSHPNSNKIFIGRITDKITSERLRDFFAEEVKKIDGDVTIDDVYIPKPFRGFGFITLSKAEVARKLCKLESVVIDGVSVAISVALRKQDEKQEPEYSPSPSEYPKGYQSGYGYPGQLGMYPGHGASRGGYNPQSPPYYNRHKRPMRGGERSPGDYTPAWGYAGYGGPAPPPPPAGMDPASGWYYPPNNIASGVDAINLNRQSEYAPRRY